MELVDDRKAMLSEEEKRTSLMRLHKNDRVKKKRSVNPEELNDIPMLLQAEQKLGDGLAFHIEQPVEIEKDEEMFGPWTTAAHSINLDCASLFDITINEQTDVVKTLDDMQPMLQKELEESLKKSLEALLKDVIEKGGSEAADLTEKALDAEVQAVIVTSQLQVITKTLKENFKKQKVGDITFTPREKDGAREKLLRPLNLAAAECVQKMEQHVSEHFAVDRAAIQKKVRKLEQVRIRLKEFIEQNTADTANQCGKNDQVDRVRTKLMRDANYNIEEQLKIVEKQQRKRKKLELADQQYDSSGSSDEDEEASADDDEDDRSSAATAKIKAARAASKDKRAEERKMKAESAAGSTYGELSEAEIAEKIATTIKRENNAEAKIRNFVMESFKAKKGGVASRETAATKEDLKDLDRLKLGSKQKDSRSPSKGRIMMNHIKSVILKKPDAYPALGPMMACYADINVSLSNFLIATTDRLCGWVDSPEFTNPWGLGLIQMEKFAEETKTLYELLIAACPTAMSASTQPDTDHDVNIRNRKIVLCGVTNDATTFIETWFTQNNYINPRKMEQMRTDVLDIKKLFYKLPLIKACTVAMTIVRNAHLQGLKISWFQTGELWIQTIMALHPNIKVELMAEKLKDCPRGVEDTDCVHCLEKLLEEVSSTAQKVQGLQSRQPNKPNANSDLYLAVQGFEVAAIVSTADKIEEDLCMTVEGHYKKSGAVKVPAKPKQGNDNRPPAAANAIWCQVIQGDPGAKCKHPLGPVETKYHKERMEKIDKMSGNDKPPKLACCGRHYFMILRDQQKLHGYGTQLRWQGNGKAPWGKNITKKDLLIGDGHQRTAAVAAVQPPTKVIIPIGAAAPAPAPAWTAPAATLAVVAGQNSPAQQAGAPEPASAPEPEPATAAPSGQSNADMMQLMLNMQEEMRDSAARQEFERIKMLKEMMQWKEMSSKDGQYTADADRARRMEKMAQLEAAGIAKDKKPSFSFSNPK